MGEMKHIKRDREAVGLFIKIEDGNEDEDEHDHEHEDEHTSGKRKCSKSCTAL